MTPQKDLLQTGNYNLNPQNLPNSTAVLVLGIFSILGILCYGIGLVPGIIGLLLANRDRKMYLAAPELYAQSSYSTLSAGRICSIIGVVLSGLLIVAVVLFLVFAFSFVNWR